MSISMLKPFRRWMRTAEDNAYWDRVYSLQSIYANSFERPELPINRDYRWLSRFIRADFKRRMA